MRIELLFLAGAPLLVVAQTVGPWGQCGGINWTGGTTCTAGHVCTSYNPYYSQCIPGTQTTTPRPPTTTTSVPPTTTSTPPTTTSDPPPTTTTSVPTGGPTIPPGTPGGLQALMRAKGKQYFGVAVDQNTLSISQISSIVNTEFGSVTPENSMKWDSTERSQGVFSLSGANYLVNYAQNNNKLVRGHTLVWHSQLPSWVSNINSAATLTQVIQNHVTTIMNAYKGKIHHWDVVNEVFEENGTWRNSVFYRLLGEQFVDIAFRAAKAADPAAKLYINDYNLDYTGPKLTAMIALVNRLRAANVPIDGIGSQAHLILNNGAIAGIATPLNQLANTGVAEIAITELDIRIPMPADSNELSQQSANYATVINACLGIPKCVGITVWGVDDGHSWVPGVFNGEGAALLWNESYQKKPAYTGVANALR